MKYADFIFQLEEGKASTLAKALLPESKREIPRTKIKIKTDKDKFLLRIEAEDTSALRAAINSYLRWIECVVKLIRFAENK